MSINFVKNRKIRQIIHLVENEYKILIEQWFTVENKSAIVFRNKENKIESFVLIKKCDFDPYKIHENPFFISFIYTFSEYRKKGNSFLLLKYIINKYELTAACNSMESCKLFEKTGFNFIEKINDCFMYRNDNKQYEIYDNNSVKNVLFVFQPILKSESDSIIIRCADTVYSILASKDPNNLIREFYNSEEIRQDYFQKNRHKFLPQDNYTIIFHKKLFIKYENPNYNDNPINLNILFNDKINFMYIKQIISDLINLLINHFILENFPLFNIKYNYDSLNEKIIITCPTFLFAQNVKDELKVLFSEKNLNISANFEIL